MAPRRHTSGLTPPNKQKMLKKKKKRLHSALPWAYVNSSHSQTSRNVWGGKLFPSSEACLAPSRTASTCNECAPDPPCTTYQADPCEPLEDDDPLHLHTSRHRVLTTTRKQASLTGLLCLERPLTLGPLASTFEYPDDRCVPVHPVHVVQGIEPRPVCILGNLSTNQYKPRSEPSPFFTRLSAGSRGSL